MSFTEAMVVIVLIFAILMIILAFISKSRSDGKIFIDRDQESGKVTFLLEVDIDPYEIENMKNVSFKVVKRQGFAE